VLISIIDMSIQVNYLKETLIFGLNPFFILLHNLVNF
jgi:hypothetical protein